MDSRPPVLEIEREAWGSDVPLLLRQLERANQELILLYASSLTTAMQHCSVYYIDVI